MNSRIFKTIFNLLMTAVGLYIFWLVLKEISWTDLSALFMQAGLWLILPVMSYAVIIWFQALDTRSLFLEADDRSTRLFHIFLVRIVGDSINKITPFLDVGGEPLKVILLVRKNIVHLKDAVVSIIVSRAGFVLSEIFFIGIAWIALNSYLPYPEMSIIILISLIMSSVYLSALLTAQLKGAVQLIPRIAAALKMDTHSPTWNEIDLELRRYFLRHPLNFCRSTVWQLVGWFAGVLEIYLFFMVMGMETTFIKCLILQAMLQSVKTVSFMIPGNLGAQEGGLALLCAHLGYTMTDGVAISLLKRFRQAFWAIIAVTLWKTVFKKESAAV